jgi:nucleoside-diphosphate-sugar epimerase
MPLIVENIGKATRDFIYIDDIVRGLILCTKKGKPGEVYNLASGVETSINELALRVNKLAGNLVPIQYGPRRKWDQSGRRFGSTQKAKKKIGFEARINLSKGLADTIEWTEQNILLIEACIKRHSLLMEQVPIR